MAKKSKKPGKLRVLEAFSGIGSQAKALKNTNILHKIVGTIEWDINACYAYDLIHNGTQDLTKYEDLSKVDILDRLSKYTLSNNSKQVIGENYLRTFPLESLKPILCALERSNNLGSITQIKAVDLPKNIDLISYSFPCQDLSVCGAWHGNTNGIKRNVASRSGMLWEVERLIMEYVDNKIALPSFLLMENVSNILSDAHKENFEEWKSYLKSCGYKNYTYTLNAEKFGIPQTRKRTFMLSVLISDDTKIPSIDDLLYDRLEKRSEGYEGKPTTVKLPSEAKKIKDLLKLDYRKLKYRQEADESNPNDTPSRKKICKNNQHILKDKKVLISSIKTITTKQDRHPNSGIIPYQSTNPDKAPYRNLTPRECFLFMGFEEEDFDALMENNIYTKKNTKIFTREKLIRFAGNSIVVPVLEEIFRCINIIHRKLQPQVARHSHHKRKQDSKSALKTPILCD